jgi:hypothetical protein
VYYSQLLLLREGIIQTHEKQQIKKIRQDRQHFTRIEWEVIKFILQVRLSQHIFSLFLASSISGNNHDSAKIKSKLLSISHLNEKQTKRQNSMPMQILSRCILCMSGKCLH